jgi:hypothetical protein
LPNAASLARAGRTVAELLVALTVGGILFALLSAAFIGHERLTSGSTAIAELRGQTRQAQQIVPALLRAVASGDLFAVQDTLADFAYPIATGIVCLPATTGQLILAPDSIASGQRLGARTHTPRPGDLAHVFDAGPLIGASDDRWWTVPIGGTAALPNGCTGSPFLDPIRDATHTARIASIVGWPGAAPPPVGAVVHFTRRTRAFLYTSSGKDYLGVSDFDPIVPQWSVVQPVSGPYASQAGVPGLQFQLLDSLGATLPLGPIPAGVATVALNVRSRTTGPLRITGMPRGPRAESLSAHVALRNR